jgi:hypothetical protein
MYFNVIPHHQNSIPNKKPKDFFFTKDDVLAHYNLSWCPQVLGSSFWIVEGIAFPPISYFQKFGCSLYWEIVYGFMYFNYASSEWG